MKNEIHQNYVHVHRLEDVWDDFRDDEDVRRLDFSRLTLEQIENLDLIKIQDTWEDTTYDLVDPIYFNNNISNTPLPPIQWSKKESKSISLRFAPIMANTNAWLLKKGIRMKQLPTSSGDD